MYVPFNKPFIVGKELGYIAECIFVHKQISGNGYFTKKCHEFFKERYGFKNVLLTTSGTDALEMSAILMRISKGDEVIVPSFTFVSSASVFALFGARIVLADSSPNNPNINPDEIDELITKRTKVVVIVHYAGISCDMKRIRKILEGKDIFLVEDCAHAIDSFWVCGEKKIPLGSFGDFSAFSFHETKNVISGEGGLLVVKDKEFFRRAEYIWEKGTNKIAFLRGEVPYYEWVDVGSSFLPSDIISAFLWAQLEHIDEIQSRRKKIWWKYMELLSPLQEKGYIGLPDVPSWATPNGHIFYITFSERDKLIDFLRKNGIIAIFHYIPLHKSRYFSDFYDRRPLPNAEKFSSSIIRLPIFYEMEDRQIEYVVEKIYEFFGEKF